MQVSMIKAAYTHAGTNTEKRGRLGVGRLTKVAPVAWGIFRIGSVLKATLGAAVRLRRAETFHVGRVSRSTKSSETRKI